MQVIEWIKVQIVYDASIRGSQVDTQTTSFGGKQKDGNGGILIEAVNQILSVIGGTASIHSQVFQIQMFHQATKQIQTTGPNRKDQDAMTLRNQRG